LSINPPSDIVLDVAKAADPLQYSAAVQKLSRLGGVSAPEQPFDLLLDSLDADEPFEPAFDPVPAKVVDWTRADLRNQLAPFDPSVSAADPAMAPARQFEAFVLQSFIQSMFPKDANHVFGEGIAGSYWSSMLAEQIAGQMAKSGGIGIAEQISASHPAAPQRFGLSAILSSEPVGITPHFDAADGEV
jgi:peptidoglycan hydrolase FlgJ